MRNAVLLQVINGLGGHLTCTSVTVDRGPLSALELGLELELGLSPHSGLRLRGASRFGLPVRPSFSSVLTTNNF